MSGPGDIIAPMSAEATRPRFIWWRALAAALGLPVVVLGYLLLTQSSGRPASLLKAWGPVAAIWAVTAFPISYLSQTGRKAASTLLSVLVIAGLFGVSEFFKVKTEERTFTSDERAGLVAVDDGGERRLRHPTLGFSLLHPGPGFAPTIDQPFRASGHFYAFDDPARGERLAVAVFKGQGESIASLTSLVETMRGELVRGEASGFESSPSAVLPADGALRSVTLSSHFKNGREARLRAYGLDVPARGPFAVLIMVVAAEPDRFSDLLASLRP
jgi:hypothetical protein